MTLVFFGSSDFSLPALKACLESSHEVLLVITTPDQRKGRGLKLLPTVVREYCEKKGIPVEAPKTLKDEKLTEKVANLKPDLFVVSAYGKLIPSNWLEIPTKLPLNVHPSLLPKYRGASPVNRPVMNGDSETGVTILEITEKLDSGDIFHQERYALDEQTDAEQLSRLLADISYHALQTVFRQIEKGALTRTPQADSLASYAKKLTKEDGRMSFASSAVQLARLVRGLKPWPGTFLIFQGSPLIVTHAEAVETPAAGKPGELLEIHEQDGSILVAAADGVLKIKCVRPAGKKEMPAADFIHGRRLQPGFIFE